MLFNSVEFLVFFPIAAMGYYLIPHKYRYLWLLACSYYFYSCWNPSYALLILFSTVITWLSGIVLEKVKGADFSKEREVRYKKVCVCVSFCLNLAVLGYFKYADFLIQNINRVFKCIHLVYQMPAVDVLLPVGISFYTFQALSYTMDVYRNDIQAERNFFRYALFVSFFPQLVAGPIERSKDLLHQLREKHSFSFEQIRSGFMLMLWGYFLKLVIADRIAIIVDTVYGDYNKYSGWYLIVASILFAFQIYCDFSGYSVIAMGAAEIMGFRLTDNFNAPYFSQSVAEFWRRWHISLSSWLRDYLYIPLGGSRKGNVRKYVNLMIVFLVSGLWHGAQWGFVVWGGVNGFYQIVGNLLQPVRNRFVNFFRLKRETFSHKLYRVLVTFILIDFSWVFFRAHDIQVSIHIIKSILTAKNIWILFDDSLLKLGLDWKNYILMLGSIIMLIFTDFCKCRKIVIRNVLCKQELWFRYLVVIGGILAILVLGIWGSGYNAESFIYFQF